MIVKGRKLITLIMYTMGSSSSAPEIFTHPGMPDHPIHPCRARGPIATMQKMRDHCPDFKVLSLQSNPCQWEWFVGQTKGKICQKKDRRKSGIYTEYKSFKLASVNISELARHAPWDGFSPDEPGGSRAKEREGSRVKCFFLKYIDFFADDFKSFRRIKGYYKCPFPYSNYYYPLPPVNTVAALASNDMESLEYVWKLCDAQMLLHCRTSLDYFDINDDKWLTTKYNRRTATTIAELRKMYADLPAKRYPTLTVDVVLTYRGDCPHVSAYTLEKLIILPQGVIRLYLGSSRYLYKDSELADGSVYDLTKRPRYAGNIEPCFSPVSKFKHRPRALVADARGKIHTYISEDGQHSTTPLVYKESDYTLTTKQEILVWNGSGWVPSQG